MTSECRSRRLCVLAAALCAWGLSRAASATDILVNDAGDALHATGCASTGAGSCTLRDAITFANANPGLDVISMTNISTRPTSSLPTITDRVTLTGTHYWYSNPGVIDGSLAGPADGLTIAADGCELLGLEIRSFEGVGIVVLGGDNEVGRFNGGVTCTMGCPIMDVRVSGNGSHGIEIRGGTNNWLVEGSSSLNGGHGIYVHAGATSNHVGFRDPPYHGLSSVVASGNRLAGVRIGDGAGDAATYGNSIDLAGLSGNAGLGIDLGGDGATPNDPLDADAGPDGLQNFPTVTSAVTNADRTATVSGTFSGAPNATVTLRFYRADTGEAPFIESAISTTDASGSALYTAVLSFLPEVASPPPGLSIPLVATATDTAGNTSELSGPMVAELPGALSLHTVAPCRLADTREAEAVGGPALMNGRARRFRVTGNCGVPLTARAVVGNVTITNPTASGHVRVAASPWPADTSTINFREDQTRANSAILALDAGSVTALPTLEGPSSGSLDLILDVSGYLE